ncbi:hypothetical protein [Streptomyces sp. TLI_105]|uniref:hypothetical protein n=1 Tax=Streptomyces sp. TLI_105 TaxID=1881019 RepID=UPI00089AB775|nr:hypothetical protein [Streptomyces sp. TLI_105]SEC88342.1 hypothetical protein SAMN05428939_3533 [Streptomyces sp. TLI_105]
MSIEESIQNADTTSPPEPDPVTETAPPVRAPRRRVLRTVGLIAVAAVIGLVGGTAVGYGIQADREPTALPPLNQPGLAYPAKPLPKGQEPAPLSAKEDRQAKAQGDLRKLLVAKPAGAKADEFADRDGWMSVSTFASDFKEPGRALDYQLGLGVRRIAVTSWASGEHKRTEVRLVQYRSGDVRGAQEYIEDQQSYMPEEKFARNEGTALKGSADGRYYVFPVQREAGYLDLYETRAYFHRGDIAVEIFMYDTEKISEKDIRSLAERQLGRL